MFWLVYCEVTQLLILMDDEENETEFFMHTFDMDDKHPSFQMASVVYWAFTTLSTVGFGDYNARSNFERVFCSFIFLFGVSVFSYIMGIFINILDEISKLNSDLDDGDHLT